jgi:hypothetical protein
MKKELSELIEEMKKIEKKNEIYNPTYEDYVNLTHRLTGYSEDVVEEYFRIIRIKKPGKLTMSDVYNTAVMEQLFFIQRGIKIKKLISKIR